VLLTVVIGTSLAAGPAEAQARKQPIFVGARVCAECHEGREAGDQYSHWRESRHAQAWEALSLPEAVEMARLSGVTAAPERSPICLGCHATAADAEPWQRDAGFALEDGVQCEKCHGPGSEYIAVMDDPEAARRAGLRRFTKRDCAVCHYVKGSHVAVHNRPPLDVDVAWEALSHPIPEAGMVRATPALATDAREPMASRPARYADPAAVAVYRDAPLSPEERRAAVRASLQFTYQTPVNLAFRPDGREVWVASESADRVVVVDAIERRKLAEIDVGRQPHDVAFHPDGSRAYVSNRLDDDVSIVDVASREVTGRLPVGDEPHGLLVDRSGRTLFVADASADRISVVDLETGTETKRLAASRNPWSMALSPDGSRLLVTNALSRFVEFREPSLSEITVIDVSEARVDDRWEAPGANLLMGIAWHPSGELALATLNRTKNLVPMTRLLQGWTISNGLAVLWRDGRVDQVLLDEPNLCFADATDVAFSPDGSRALVTSSGTDRVAVIDVEKLLALLRSHSDEERRELLPNHLGSSPQFVLDYVPTGRSPRGIAVSPDGRTAWVASSLDDTLTVIDLEALAPLGTVDLGGPGLVTHLRRGEQLFHSAKIAFQRQFSCHSCHPDGHVDGLTYDIEPDGIGVSPVDNRTLRGIYDTDPFKWTGKNVSLARQCGPRLAVFFTRIQPFTEAELAALNDYTVTLPRPPNRYRPLGAELTPAQSRGKVLFERRYANDGSEIPPRGRCVTCHFAPYYTDRTQQDVGTRQPSDHTGTFDVPHLNNIYDSAPYLHNGMAHTLEEIWTRFNPYDQHGVTNDMTKDQLNDLIEFLKTL